MPLDPTLKNWVSGFAAREGAARLARELSVVGIDVMPIKGALLGATVFPRGVPRGTKDIDVLVRAGSRQAAERRLRALGYERETSAPHASTWLHAKVPLPVDLHESPFPFGLFRLTTEALFARGSRDEALFRAPVWLPTGLDTYALSLGHAAKDREPHAERLRELAPIAAHYRLEPRALAAHLQRAGLARAARWLLAVAWRELSDAFARRTLDHLRADPVGSLLANVVDVWVRAAGARRRAHMPACHLVNASLLRAGASFARQLWQFPAQPGPEPSSLRRARGRCARRREEE